jgi:2-methylisocitrate lyase-like PEP mutase family enzyme
MRGGSFPKAYCNLVLNQIGPEASMIPAAQVEKAARFAALHESGCFILPNAWDMPSAALIVEAGFPALATTSAGVAFAHGLPDGENIGRDRMLAVAGEIAARVPVPVTADLEAGYGPSPEDVADTVKRAIAVGLVGCNIEDADPSSRKLFEFDAAVARIRAGVNAAQEAGLPDFCLNARADPWLIGFGTPEQNFNEAVKRANAYLTAGARSAFVPGFFDATTVGDLAKAIKGPLNVLAYTSRDGDFSLEKLRELGVRRVSLGSSLMLAAYAFTRRSLQEIASGGSFDYAAGAISFAEMTKLLTK